MRNVLTWGAVIAMMVGMKFANKSSEADDIRFFVEYMCPEEGCLQTVEANFESCFESSYQIDGRGTSAKVDLDPMMTCITADTEDYFGIQEGASYEW